VGGSEIAGLGEEQGSLFIPSPGQGAGFAEALRCERWTVVAGDDPFDDVGRKESQGDQAADVTPVHTRIPGNVRQRKPCSRRQALEPAPGLQHHVDELWIRLTVRTARTLQYKLDLFAAAKQVARDLDVEQCVSSSFGPARAA
jgi:hypothetical protein